MNINYSGTVTSFFCRSDPELPLCEHVRPSYDTIIISIILIFNYELEICMWHTGSLQSGDLGEALLQQVSL